jgi:hypothetical protein
MCSMRKRASELRERLSLRSLRRAYDSSIRAQHHTPFTAKQLAVIIISALDLMSSLLH